MKLKIEQGIICNQLNLLDPNIADSKFERYSTEEAFKGIQNLSEPNSSPVIIVSQQQLERTEWEESYTCVNNRRAQEQFEEIREMYHHIPRLGRVGHRGRRHGHQGKGKYARL